MMLEVAGGILLAAAIIYVLVIPGFIDAIFEFLGMAIWMLVVWVLAMLAVMAGLLLVAGTLDLLSMGMPYGLAVPVLFALVVMIGTPLGILWSKWREKQIKQANKEKWARALGR